MRAIRVAAALALAAGPAGAEAALEARLEGFAALPAASFTAPPEGAPADAAVSGKWATGSPGRVDAPESRVARTGAAHGSRETGFRLPFRGQPVQGVSGFSSAPEADGTLLAIADNGFGGRLNSPDALLSALRLAPDFGTGAVRLVERIWLRDPDRVVPFRLAYEGTAARHLTGADFDPESIQRVGGDLWIGDEFGPWLIRATPDGVVTGLFAAELDRAPLRSADHPRLRIPATAGRDWRVPRSGGFEGLGLQPGTGLLWAMLEKPILDASGAPEAGVRALAFDPEAGRWTGEGFRFRLGPGAEAIGDLAFVDARRAWVIERDWGEGDPSLACREGAAPGDPCFASPARVKRLVLIDVGDRDAAGFVRRIGSVDLMALADPDGLGPETDAARDLSGLFTFPFVTIEAVAPAGPGRVLVGNDNNLPFSTGRRLDRAADGEIVLLSVPGAE